MKLIVVDEVFAAAQRLLLAGKPGTKAMQSASDR
jgi:hypothetical protein